MGWPFRQPDPDPEKEKKLQEQSKAEMEEFTMSLRTSLEEAIAKPLREEITALRTKIESSAPKPAVRTEAPPEIPSVLDNEEAAFAARIGPVAIQTGLLNARMTEVEVLSDVSIRGWGHLIPQIREVLEKQTPVQTKISPSYKGYLENVVDMLIGKEAKSKGLKFDGNKQTFFLEDASGTGNTPANSKMRQLEHDATDGRIDILKGRSVAEWAKNMGISNPDSLLEGGN
jgi:hypothetical protein